MNPEHITWLYLPMAVLLGALHGLEPGHSKTMMAAFIIAIRGTIVQAVLLGASAALSHSLIIWALAAAALHFGQQWNTELVEPYLQLFAAGAIMLLALWMFRRTRREVLAHHHHHHHHGHSHHHDHGHHHDHPDEGGNGDGFLLDTGHGLIRLAIFEDGEPPVFRVTAPPGQRLPSASSVTLQTVRGDGSKQDFTFALQAGHLQSVQEIPEPHEFKALVSIGHSGHEHLLKAEFSEAGHADHRHHDHGHANGHHHHHGHSHHHRHEDGPVPEEFEDAHERAHAEDIRRRFDGRHVTTPQIVWFGITGGLMPCPAAFSVLFICLQLKKVTLGFFMVAAFSLGLALTMVATGVLAAWSVRHAEKKFRGFGDFMRKAPYISCLVMLVIAAYMAWHGWQGLQGHGHGH